MKSKYFSIIAAFCLATGISGCHKFLDQQPITEIGPEMVFSDVPSTLKALAGVYSRLVGDQGYGIRLSLYYTVDTDERQGPTGNADNDRRDIARYSATASNAQLSGPFSQLFQGIEYANICIDNIPKMDLYSNGSDQQKKQLQRMYGEALTLRAQFYSEAIRNWGDLPADFQPAGVLAVATPFPKRVDRDSLYAQMLSDLKTAEDLVPWRNEVTSIGDALDQRLTKGAVKGLRARIALARGGYSLRQSGGMQRGSNYATYYQIARDECNDIITSGQHSLNPSYKALWKDQVCARAATDPNGELMFQASAYGSAAAEDTKLGYYNGPTVGSFGNKSINPIPTYFYLFDSTDTRRDVTICSYNVNADGAIKVGQPITTLNDGKYRRDWISNPVVTPTNAIQYFGLAWQVLRYSDVLLMFAEAENEINGPTAAAYTAINTVRRRGFGKAIGTVDATVDLPAGLSKTDFFKAIVKERSLELGGEGVRKFDLIRWNLLATALTDTKTNLTKLASDTTMSATSYMAAPPAYVLQNKLPASMYYKTNTTADDNTIWSNSFYTRASTATPSGTTKVTWISAAVNTTTLARFATGFIIGKSELLPLPQSARDANSSLTQNPGY